MAFAASIPNSALDWSAYAYNKKYFGSISHIEVYVNYQNYCFKIHMYVGNV